MGGLLDVTKIISGLVSIAQWFQGWFHDKEQQGIGREKERLETQDEILKRVEKKNRIKRDRGGAPIWLFPKDER